MLTFFTMSKVWHSESAAQKRFELYRAERMQARLDHADRKLDEAAGIAPSRPPPEPLLVGDRTLGPRTGSMRGGACVQCVHCRAGEVAAVCRSRL